MFFIIIVSACSRAGDAALTVSMPAEVELFDKAELEIHFPPAVAAFLNRLPDTQIHDAYDADGDGVYVRLNAEFIHDKGSITVPGFAMRSKAGGAWNWRVRFSPRHEGIYHVRVHLDAGTGKQSAPIVLDQMLDATLTAVTHRKIAGPLISPGPREPPLLRELTGDDSSRALWLFGACRAWDVDEQDANNTWSPHEWFDRETELFAPMRASGYNLLNQWMAPWEFLLVHHDRAEFWKNRSKGLRRIPLPDGAEWSSYQCFDQGRAAAFDELVESCEGTETKPPIYLLLAPVPHQCFQVSDHPWGKQESGWSPSDDGGKQSRERLFGFSGFAPSGKNAPDELGVWDFFRADPEKPADDWRCRLFDHQANLYRYLIARWGYSRAIGVWVLADELDAVGDAVGDRARQRGWWAHPQCERWLANLVRLFHGELKRSDGLAYSGDPFKHPLHAATTSSRGQAERGGNIDWEGGPEGAQPDLFGFHWYPYWENDSTWDDVWNYTIAGVGSYARAPIGNHPRLMSEFGAPDRAKPGDEPSYLYPTLYHHAIWAAIFSGHAGTPMDWDDGKEFGEMTFRKREGIFDEKHYPIDNTEQIRALRVFLKPLSPEHLLSCSGDHARVTCNVKDGAQTFAQYDTRTTSVYGWPFTSKDETEITLNGLKPGKYQLRWFDPWTGKPLELRSQTIIVDKETSIRIDALRALKEIRSTVPPFPKRSRLARGQDAAFKLEADSPKD